MDGYGVLALLASYVLVACQVDIEEKNYPHVSTVKMEELFIKDAYIVSELENFIENPSEDLDSVLKSMEWYVERYRLISSKKTAAEVAAHPLEGYQLIKSIVVDWFRIVNSLGSDAVNKSAFITKLQAYREENDFPELDDINGAAVALMRLQRTYELEYQDLLEGKIVNTIQGANNTVFGSIHTLSSWDCVVFGRSCVSQHWYDMGYTWGEIAGLLYEAGDTSIPKSTIEEFLSDVTEQHDTTLIKHRSSSPFGYAYDTPIDEYISSNYAPGNIVEPTPFSPKFYQYLNPVEQEEQKDRLCRGEQLLPPTIHSDLVCRYLTNDNPYLLIGPMKLEEKSKNPALMAFHDFMVESEMNRYKELAAPLLANPRYESKKDPKIVKAKIPAYKEVYLNKDEDPFLYSRISLRIQNATGLDVTSPNAAEKQKVVNYGMESKTGYHVNFFGDTENPFVGEGGERLATFIVFLSDATAGGAMAFPYLGVSVFPKKGMGLMWYNLDRAGVGDHFTAFSICPMLYGSKWSHWNYIFMYDQMFKRGCGVNVLDKHTVL